MRFSFASALALVPIVAAAAAARAQVEVTTTLMHGAEPLIFSGTAKWQQHDRYIFVARKDARISAALTPTDRFVVLDVLRAEDAAPHPRIGGHYTHRVETRLFAEGRHVVVVMFDPRANFEAAPKPAAYRLELKLE